MTLVVYEDRPGDWIGVQILLRSVARHHPEWSVKLFLPECPEELRRWCESQSLAEVKVISDLPRRGWNSKPECLRRELEGGAERVVWLDSDTVLAGCLDRVFATEKGTVIAAEESPWVNGQGSDARVRGWNFPIGRSFNCSINSCVVVMDRTHIPLLRRWEELLSSSNYTHAQTLPWNERPLHLMGDQDVLNALLGSTEFSHVPVQLLRNGREIAQCFEEDGFRVCDRVKAYFAGLPPVLHAQGSKPWRNRKRGMLRWSLELSPYSYVAAQVASDVPGVREWSRPQSIPARLLNLLVHPALRGLPLAMIRTSIRLVGRTARALFGIGSNVAPRTMAPVTERSSSSL